MSRLAISLIFMASLGIGFAAWLVFDRFFVQRHHQLLNRFDRADAVDAAVTVASGGRVAQILAKVCVAASVVFSSGAMSKAQRVQLFELPDIVDFLAVALSSGESLYAALVRVSERASGVVGVDLRRVVLSVQVGGSLPVALGQWSARANSRQIAELCTKLQLALVRGTPLAEMLSDQAETLRAEVQQVIAKKAGQNETRMLVPLIFLILPITVLFAVYPSLQVLTITQ